MDDEKKIDTSGQHFEHAPNGEPAIHETDLYREGFSFRRVFHRPDNSKFFQEALDKYGEDGSIDPEAERRLVRKLDWTIIPILGICYVFYYVDKTTLSYAAIFGIREPKPVGLNLQGTDYSWLSSIFYFGWLAWAIPSNLLLQKSPAATYLGFNIFMWGVLLMAQAAAQSFGALLALRFLSGAAEAIADPAFMLVTSMFYTRAEQPWRISCWYAFNGVGTAFGGLLGFAIGNIKGALQSWRYEFIVIGAVCSAWGLLILFLLPSSPATSVWLNRDERLMAVARLRGNQTGIESSKIKIHQIKEAFMDPKTYLFFLLGFVGNIPNGGISNFSTLIIRGLGFDTLKTALLGIPQGALVVIWITAGAFLNSRMPPNSRTIVCMLFMIPTIGGALGFLLAPKDAYVGRLIAFYMTGSYQTTFVLSLSLITSNVAGQSKKMVVTALIWFGACVGNIAGPSSTVFLQSRPAPTYKLGIGSMLAANIIEVLIILGLRLNFIRANKRKALQRAALEAAGVEEDDLKGVRPTENSTAFADLTDFENPKRVHPSFVYVY
ncbi:major facilitator superfamily domain-containing protein [Mrakia frigida]|uniref:major facilitator superfamily domain-containing protein n=1 Tax=Mrakia frigida TaxID=29902 RepID=UPI003FCBFB6D